jgi:ferredoxin-NADP reductase
MLRHHAANDSHLDARLLLSARASEDLLYRNELAVVGRREAVEVHYTLTRTPPADWAGFTGRVNAEMLTAVGPAPDAQPQAFVCGPTAFVEHVADLLVALGHLPLAIRAERFGPTGG